MYANNVCRTSCDAAAPVRPRTTAAESPTHASFSVLPRMNSATVAVVPPSTASHLQGGREDGRVRAKARRLQRGSTNEEGDGGCCASVQLLPPDGGRAMMIGVLSGEKYYRAWWLECSVVPRKKVPLMLFFLHRGKSGRCCSCSKCGRAGVIWAMVTGVVRGLGLVSVFGVSVRAAGALVRRPILIRGRHSPRRY